MISMTRAPMKVKTPPATQMPLVVHMVVMSTTVRTKVTRLATVAEAEKSFTRKAMDNAPAVAAITTNTPMVKLVRPKTP